ncbi:hypothetical protein FXO38_12889 [Capsicum annuum]|nr:hypothetical protein FXO38_12889 [Capsicum annuum]
MDDTLFDAYCHEDALGHRVGGTFTMQAMDNIMKDLRFKFLDKAINKKKIHNRMKTIKRQFTNYHDTFHQSGMSEFAWDPITHKWDVNPGVWDQLIQVKPQVAELKKKSFQNYKKLVMLYGKNRATTKHDETGSDMLKRNAHKNPRKSSVDSFSIHEINKIGYINTDSLKDMEGHELGNQSQATNDAPTPNIYSEAPVPTKNKKSKHEHLEGTIGM